MHQATARANANIAFIKYWGNLDDSLRLPANPSLSMNLDGLFTETTVAWLPDSQFDTLHLNGVEAAPDALARVSKHLDILRQRFGIAHHARVVSANNFPTGAGIASSAAAFAALTVAGIAAAGKLGDVTEREMTTIARLGSGSASRSIPAGFVEWRAGAGHEASYAETFASADHWALVDLIAVVSAAHKRTGSTEGHQSANTSDLQMARVSGANDRLALCKAAILERDFNTFATVVEHDSNLMHAVMMTSRPPLFYWQPASLLIMEAVRTWRAEGLNVCYTLDAGPNVHCICTEADAAEVRKRLETYSEVKQVLAARPGGGAAVVSST